MVSQNNRTEAEIKYESLKGNKYDERPPKPAKMAAERINRNELRKKRKLDAEGEDENYIKKLRISLGTTKLAPPVQETGVDSNSTKCKQSDDFEMLLSRLRSLSLNESQKQADRQVGSATDL